MQKNLVRKCLDHFFPQAGNARIMTISGIFFTMATVAWFSIFPIYLNKIVHFKCYEIGLTFSVATFGSIISNLAGGVTADRVGRKKRS